MQNTELELQAIKQELKELNNNIIAQNNYYTFRQIFLRSLVTGLFTALGATIGFAIVILFLASFLNTISGIPFVEDILEQTGIQTIINHQLEQIDQSTQD